MRIAAKAKSVLEYKLIVRCPSLSVGEDGERDDVMRRWLLTSAAQPSETADWSSRSLCLRRLHHVAQGCMNSQFIRTANEPGDNVSRPDSCHSLHPILSAP